MEKRNILIDLFGWTFLASSAYKTVLTARYLNPPYLEPINYSFYTTLYQKIAMTANVWIIPTISAVISPLFMLVGMGIIFRQKWARLLLVAISMAQLLFVAMVVLVASFFDPLWMIRNFGSPYHDEVLWFVVIPILCIFVFTRPEIKRSFQ